MKELETMANEAARLRDKLDPIRDGKITRGHACFAKGDHTATPGQRKTTLADARKIVETLQPRLNTLANDLIETARVYRDAVENLKCWVKVIRRGDMGDFSPVMDEIFDSESVLEQIKKLE